MGRKATLKPRADGNIPRQLGSRPDGTKTTFFLGRDSREATLRNALLERLWEANDSEHWDAVTLEIAKAVARGDKSYTLAPNPHFSMGESQAHWFARYECLCAGIIRLVPEKPHVVAEGLKDSRDRRHEELANAIRRIDIGYPDLDPEGRGLPTGQTLHQALQAYTAHLGETLRDTAGNETAWGAVKPTCVRFLICHTENVDLSALTTAHIDRVIDTIRRRPPARTHAAQKAGGKPISAKYAKTCIGVWRHFIRWLHKADGWRWKKPDDFEVTSVRVEVTPDERAAKGRDRVPTYSLTEVRTLWEYASPYERVYLTLALNCGFGPMEIGTLRREELLLRQRHPESDSWNMASESSDSWVMRNRLKTGVYGEWRLWPVTVQAIDWYLSHRPESKSPILILSRKGQPLVDHAIGRHDCQKIANLWSRLVTRVRQDQPMFRYLPFKMLRKTSSNLIRQRFGDELSSLFLSHGESLKRDESLSAYTNPRFAALHGAISLLGKEFETAIWSAVSNPFPKEWKQGGPNISRETINRIGQLASTGKRIGEIADETGVSRETVRRWLNRLANRDDKKLSETA